MYNTWYKCISLLALESPTFRRKLTYHTHVTFTWQQLPHNFITSETCCSLAWPHGLISFPSTLLLPHWLSHGHNEGQLAWHQDDTVIPITSRCRTFYPSTFPACDFRRIKSALACASRSLRRTSKFLLAARKVPLERRKRKTIPRIR